MSSCGVQLNIILQSHLCGRSCPRQVTYEGPRSLQGLVQFVEENCSVKVKQILEDKYPAYSKRHNIPELMTELRARAEHIDLTVSELSSRDAVGMCCSAACDRAAATRYATGRLKAGEIVF